MAQFSGARGAKTVTGGRRGGVGSWREKRPAQRPGGVARRTAQAGARGRAAGDPVPPLPRVAHRGAPVSRGPHRDRSDRAAGKPRRLRGGEGPTRGRVREPARGSHGRQAAGAGEGGAGLGGSLWPAGGHPSLRFYSVGGREVGASSGRGSPPAALGRASGYIRAPTRGGPGPLSRKAIMASNAGT